MYNEHAARRGAGPGRWPPGEGAHAGGGGTRDLIRFRGSIRKPTITITTNTTTTTTTSTTTTTTTTSDQSGRPSGLACGPPGIMIIVIINNTS